ncbi:MAG TPA: hypothetical protein VN873_13585 [Candidatus Angelobacter sp.]|nr:hypothetical protein [Candidatus Angelobacter sp.]
MNSEPCNHDEALKKLLKEWRIKSSLPQNFQESVWKRIERTRIPKIASVFANLRNWLDTALPRPILTACYLAVLLTAGLTGGLTQAHQKNVRVKGELGERYVHSIDPYQARHEAAR